MKKAIIASLMVFAVMLLSAQSWNPFVNQGTITPAPLLPTEFGGIGTVAFNIGNTGSDALVYDNGNPANNLGVTITLNNGVPNKNNALAALGGTWKGRFNWSYDPATRTYIGTQKNTLQGYSQGTLTVDYKVTANSPMSAAANGVSVTLQPPAYTGGPNHTQDDAVSSYTFTRAYDYGDAPASYGQARHEIDVNRDPATGQYTKYIYMGTKVDQEADALSSPKARGDDQNGVDDEDGVTFPQLVAGTTVTIPIVVTTHDQSWGMINAWFDWNGDGDFNDAGEKAPGNPLFVFSSGTYNLTVSIPGDAITSQKTFARFRIGNNSGPTAPNAWGEAEDYEISILPGGDQQPPAPLPEYAMNLITLKGERKGADILLTWEMPEEINTSHFVVERSLDGEAFSPAGQSIEAAGNSFTKRSYTYTDLKVFSEIAVYRIRLVQKDLAEKLSNTHTEILDTDAELIVYVYPIPVGDWYNVAIETPGSYRLELISSSGNICFISSMEVLTGRPEVKKFPRTDIIAGQYFLRVTDKNEMRSKTLKVIIGQ